MSKFKVGDRVVFTDKYAFQCAHLVGRHATITRRHGDSGVYFLLDGDTKEQGWYYDCRFTAANEQAYIINGANYEYPTLEAAEAGVKAIGNNGATYEIAQIVKRVTVKRETVVTLEETV